ncbi:MAG: hypothetical protein EOP50_14580 [Sphingobacteriales bacterium]|nr:MAG: hypothetical protein EOP50_14580 [Sphingobacteriales bacterium]
MPTEVEQVRALLSDLETEFAELVTAHAPADKLQIVSRLILRARHALEEHVVEVPPDLQQHPSIVALREKMRRDRAQL